MPKPTRKKGGKAPKAKPIRNKNIRKVIITQKPKTKPKTKPRVPATKPKTKDDINKDRFKVQMILDRYDYKIDLIINETNRLPMDHPDRPEKNKEYNQTVKALYRALLNAKFSKVKEDEIRVSSYMIQLSRKSPFPQVVMNKRK